MNMKQIRIYLCYNTVPSSSKLSKSCTYECSITSYNVDPRERYATQNFSIQVRFYYIIGISVQQYQTCSFVTRLLPES